MKPTQTQSVGHGSIVGWVPANAPALQDGARLNVFTHRIIMYGIVTQQHDMRQSEIRYSATENQFHAETIS